MKNSKYFSNLINKILNEENDKKNSIDKKELFYKKLFSFFELERMFGSNVSKYEIEHKKLFFDDLEKLQKIWGNYLFFPINVDENSIIEFGVNKKPILNNYIFEIKYYPPYISFAYLNEKHFPKNFQLSINKIIRDDMSENIEKILNYDIVLLNLFNFIADEVFSNKFPIPTGFNLCIAKSIDSLFSEKDINAEYLFVPFLDNNLFIFGMKQKDINNVFTKEVFNINHLEEVINIIGLEFDKSIFEVYNYNFFEYVNLMLMYPILIGKEKQLEKVITSIMSNRTSFDRITFQISEILLESFELKVYENEMDIKEQYQNEILMFSNKNINNSVVKGRLYKL